MILFPFDLIGVAVFAVSGAPAAGGKGLDLLSFVVITWNWQLPVFRWAP
jgi:uncharacterized membrane protein YeiH